MAGLFDFLNSPAGMGLLSAVATGAAGARQGTPWNNVGRGAMGGLAGYANANDQIRQDEENAFQKQFRQTQMEQMQRQLETQRKQEQWRAGLPGVMAPNVSEQGAMLNEQNAAFGDEGTQATMAAGQYAPNAQLRMTPQVDQQAVQDYMLQPESPYADKLMEKQLFPSAADYKTVGKTLLRVGANGQVEPVYTDQSPEKSDAPSKVKEYEYAVQNGFKGSFTDYIKIVPEAQAGYMFPFRQAERDSGEAKDAYNLPPSVTAPKPNKAPQSFSVTAPDGSVFNFPSKAAAAAFKRQIGGQ